jgi:hypothetical protein
VRKAYRALCLAEGSADELKAMLHLDDGVSHLQSNEPLLSTCADPEPAEHLDDVSLPDVDRLRSPYLPKVV